MHRKVHGPVFLLKRIRVMILNPLYLELNDFIKAALDIKATLHELP